MKIISPNVKLIQQESGFDGMLKHIERCGRTCYKSEDKITDDSADTFVANLIKNKHYAMLEHGTVYLKQTCSNGGALHKYEKNPYSVVTSHYDHTQHKNGRDFFYHIYYVTTNYRVLEENGWLDDLNYVCEPTEFHIPRITLKFTTNIGVTREGNRMRANSIAEESTRYCNYTKGKFGNEITFVRPVWFKDFLPEGHYDMKATSFECNGKTININSNKSIRAYLFLLHCSEDMYLRAIENGATPQQAREVLPLATKSEVVYTAFPHQWKHFFDLRLFGTTGKPHPNMEEIAKLAKKVLEENNLWNWIYTPYTEIQ